MKPRLPQFARYFLLASIGWFTSASAIFAKEGSTESGSQGGTWVFSYFIVGLGVVLGMLVVCRSSNRRDRLKPEAYHEGKASGTEQKK
jgi:hypothetical protein